MFGNNGRQCANLLQKQAKMQIKVKRFYFHYFLERIVACRFSPLVGLVNGTELL